MTRRPSVAVFSMLRKVLSEGVTVQMPSGSFCTASGPSVYVGALKSITIAAAGVAATVMSRIPMPSSLNIEIPSERK
jgi:hypothetical protein